MRTQVEEDAFQAWIYASNCLLYENDPGPAELNTGTNDEPRMVPRAQAWQHAYALNVIVQCEADHARLTAAASQCRASIADAAARLGAQRACEWSRAADLCDQAARMVEDAGAIGEDKARRRLLAGCQHQTMMIALGSVIPAVAESSADDLKRALREIGEEPSELPEAMTHYPWSASRPGCKPLPQPGHIVRTETVAAEHGIVQPVKPPACVGEVLILKTRLQLAGQADQLVNGVALKGCGNIDDIPFFCPGREARTLAAIASRGFRTGPTSMDTGARLRSKWAI